MGWWWIHALIRFVKSDFGFSLFHLAAIFVVCVYWLQPCYFESMLMPFSTIFRIRFWVMVCTPWLLTPLTTRHVEHEALFLSEQPCTANHSFLRCPTWLNNVLPVQSTSTLSLISQPRDNASKAFLITPFDILQLPAAGGHMHNLSFLDIVRINFEL